MARAHAAVGRVSIFSPWGSSPCSSANVVTGWLERAKAASTSRASSVVQRWKEARGSGVTVDRVVTPDGAT